jgi:type III pantothenate kinase
VLLVYDIGNTAITCGLFENGRLVSFASNPAASCVHDDFWKRFSENASSGEIHDVVIASVNPSAEKKLGEWARRKFKKKPLVIGKNLHVRVPLSYRNPKELGADRLANALAATKLFDRAAVVVDFGTAVTFDVISSSGRYLGGIIAPGISLTRRALAEWTALLPLVDVSPGGPLIGKTTEEAVNAGLFHGIVAMVDGLLFKLINKLRTKPRIIATGGDGKAITRQSVFIEKWIPDLTLQGLFYAYEDHVKHSR